jgi:DNA-binding IclR family transcriptional regulator
MLVAQAQRTQARQAKVSIQNETFMVSTRNYILPVHNRSGTRQIGILGPHATATTDYTAQGTFVGD